MSADPRHACSVCLELVRHDQYVRYTTTDTGTNTFFHIGCIHRSMATTRSILFPTKETAQLSSNRRVEEHRSIGAKSWLWAGRFKLRCPDLSTVSLMTGVKCKLKLSHIKMRGPDPERLGITTVSRNRRNMAPFIVPRKAQYDTTPMPGHTASTTKIEPADRNDCTPHKFTITN